MKKTILTLTTLLTLGACATRGPHEGTHRGSVVMKMQNGEAHVCLGNSQVKTGDAVTLVRHECKAQKLGSRSGASEFNCSPVVLGTGVVSKVYDEHYSVVKFPTELNFKEGDLVEKASLKN